MKKGLRFVCVAISVVTGAWLWLGYFGALSDWFGSVLGGIIAVVVIPGLPFFPFVYWYVEGRFPDLYFLLMAISASAGMLAAWAFSKETQS